MDNILIKQSTSGKAVLFGSDPRQFKDGKSKKKVK